MLNLPLIILGAALVIASSYSLGRFVFPSLALPHTIRFGLGAAILSHVILALALTGALYSRPLTALLILLALPLLRVRPGWRWNVPDRHTLITFGPIAIVYGVLYAVNALAPEIQPDAAGYHLGLVREWHIHNGFPDRIGFYEVLPQGLEMLFAAAFDIGGHSAAKLVHFAFLIATVPLLFATGKQLGMERWQAAVPSTSTRSRTAHSPTSAPARPSSPHPRDSGTYRPSRGRRAAPPPAPKPRRRPCRHSSSSSPTAWFSARSTR